MNAPLSVLPLPLQEGCLRNSQECVEEGPSQRSQREDDSILEHLERFSAILRDPPNSTPFPQPHPRPQPLGRHSHLQSHQNKNSNNNRKRTNNRFRRRAQFNDDIKRTSSLYDISFTYLELDDEDTEEKEAEKPLGRITQSFTVTPQRRSHSFHSEAGSSSTELSLAASVEITAKAEDISEGNVSGLLSYLDQLPGAQEALSVQETTEQLARRIDEAAEAIATSTERHDSGITSVESGALNHGATTTMESSPGLSRVMSTSQFSGRLVEAPPFYPGLQSLPVFRFRLKCATAFLTPCYNLGVSCIYDGGAGVVLQC